MNNYWWHTNIQNRVNKDEQLMLCEELDKIEKYTYSYYSNTNFLRLNDKTTLNGRKYRIRLDHDSDFRYFSTILGVSPLYDNALENINDMTSSDIRALIENTAKLYPENVARYYSNEGVYQYVLLDYTDKGHATIKMVPDKFIPSSYTAFRPVLHRINIRHDVNDGEEYADEYKFISEDGCYLIDQSKLNSLDDVLFLISINPCYIDQINPQYFTNNDMSNNIQNLDIIKSYIEKAFGDNEVALRILDTNRPLYTKRIIKDDIVDLVNAKKGVKYNYKGEKQLTDKEILSLVHRRVNQIVKDKVNELKFIEQYQNYAIESYEKAFLDLGLIPNVNGLKEKFLPPLKKKAYLSKDTKAIIRRFMRLSYLKSANEKLELYRSEVLSKIKELPQENDYISYGEEKANIIRHNELIAKYEREVLSSGYKYKNKNTGIISALNNEFNELNAKISKYFTLPTIDTVYDMARHLEKITEDEYDIENIYIPHDDHHLKSYNSRPMVCIVNKDHRKEYGQYLKSYVIENGSNENAHLKNIHALIEKGIIIPICMTSSNFGVTPSVNNFREQKTIFSKKVLVNGELTDISINTYSIKRVNRANQIFKGLKNLVIELADNNVKKVDRPNKK